MQAYILPTIIAKDLKTITGLLHITAATSDTIELTLNETSIGVAEVRAFTDQLRLAPTAGQIRLGIIRSAQALTTEAQNALLKTLEEPPPRVIIVLETTSITALLPTVLSRCQIVTNTSDNSHSTPTPSGPNIISLIPLKLGERLAATDTLGQSKQDVSAWMGYAHNDIHQAILAAYGIAHVTPIPAITPFQIAHTGKKLLHAHVYLHANVTPRLILDSILIDQNESVDNQEIIV